MRKLFGVIIVIIATLACVSPPARAQAFYVPGYDKIGDVIQTNLITQLTNGGSIAASVSTTVVFRALINSNQTNNVHSRLFIMPDLAQTDYIGYVQTVITNSTSNTGSNVFKLPTTRGFVLLSGPATSTNAYVNQRPYLWSDAFGIYFSATVPPTNIVISTNSIILETPSPL